MSPFEARSREPDEDSELVREAVESSIESEGDDSLLLKVLSLF